MSGAKLVIKNYRCFSEKNPVTIDIEKGFISFIGPNNSGKSSLLRLIYEFRHVFINAISHQRTQAYDENKPLLVYNLEGLGGSLLSVQDYDEIFCNFNDSNVTIELALSSAPSRDSTPSILTKIRFVLERGRTHKCSVFYDWTPKVMDTPTEGHKLEIKDGKLIQRTAGSRIIADCNQLFTVINHLCNSIYIGAFRNAINQGAGNYFDISLGTSFISIWNTWKTGPNKTQNNRIVEVTDDIRKLLGFGSLEINASDDKTTLQVLINKKPYVLREIGAGMAQLIVVLANVAIKNPTYILIDEPELNLHPSLQADFLTSLASYASEGIFFATHSMGLARANSERIYSVQIIDDTKYVVKPLGNTPNYAEFLGEMSFSSYKEMGFEHVLLVEGPTDVKTVQQLLRKINIDHKVVIIHLGGDGSVRGGMEEELGELLRITPNISALVDSERSKAGREPIKNRRDFEKDCKKLNINVHLTERRAMENYFSDKAIKSEKGSKYSALGEYEKFGNIPLSWGKSENWRIVRRMEWSELESTDVGKFLADLKKKMED